MAEAHDLSRGWSVRRARRRSSEFWSALRPREILGEHRNGDGALRGPYETEYVIANGYDRTDPPER